MNSNLKPIFNRPPLDYSLNLLDMIDYNVLHSPNHAVFQYLNSNTGTTQRITWKDAGSAFYRAARIIQSMCSAIDFTEDSKTPVVIGILANIDSITYITLLVGAMLAGMVPFLISNRNSPAAVAHLLREWNCKLVIASEDDISQSQLYTAFNIFKNNDPTSQPILSLSSPTYEDLYESGDQLYPQLRMFQDISHDSLCIIIHSSGSVSFPKPVKLSFRMLLEHGISASKGEVDLCGVFGGHGIPIYREPQQIYHRRLFIKGLDTFGVYLFASCVTLGMTLSLFSPKENHIPSPELILMQAVETNCSILASVPSFIEMWAHDKHKVELLKGFTAVIFGGGPLSTAVGDYLVKQGVNIIPMYGLTEVGTVSLILPAKPPSEGWEWLRTGYGVDLIFIPAQMEGDKIYRLIVKPNQTKSIAVSNTTVDGIAAFDTNDLVIRHPTNPLLWKIFGREDDQIIHSTGVREDKSHSNRRLAFERSKISAAVMFGRSKFQPGVLIQPSPSYIFDTNDRFKLAEYRNSIWPTIEAANEEAPQYSRIYKEYMLVANPSKPFEFTGKGTPRRNAVLEAYADEIEHIYTDFESQELSKVALSVNWSAPEIRGFVRKIFASVLRHDIADNESIFHVGGDSLSAASICNSLTRALHLSNLPTSSLIRNIPSEILYMFPSVDTLTAYVYGLLSQAPISEYQSTSEADSSEGNEVPERFLDSVEDSTVVKLRIGNPEEIPLIVLHGAGGSFSDFLSMLEAYTSALWAIQITNDAPVTSVEALAEFYCIKIQEEQPVGPYRLASYSGSSVVLVRLVQLFESKGDVVSQFSFLDHFPTLYIHGLPDVWNSELLSSRHVIIEDATRRGAEFVCQLVKDGNIDADKEFRQRFADDMLSALDGRPSGELAKTRVKNICTLVKISLEFLLADSFSSFDENRRILWKEKILQWMRSVKSRPTVYVAKDGLRSIHGINDLGAREVYDDARIVEIDGNHFNFLVNPELLSDLKNY